MTLIFRGIYMKYATLGWVTAALGAILLATGAATQQPLYLPGSVVCTAGVALVIFGQLEGDRTHRAGGIAWRPPSTRSILARLPRHARPATSARTALRLIATLGTTVRTRLLRTVAPIRSRSGNAASRIAAATARLARRPATYPAVAAIGLGATFFLAGLPGVDPGGDGGPSAALPAHAQPADPSGPSATASPTPVPTRSTPELSYQAPPPGAASASGKLAPSPWPSSGQSPSPRANEEPDETPSSEPAPEETPGPAPQPSPSVTSSPGPVPVPTPTPSSPPDDDDRDCILGLLDLCLISSG